MIGMVAMMYPAMTYGAVMTNYRALTYDNGSLVHDDCALPDDRSTMMYPVMPAAARTYAYLRI